jgi:hypothetical protein
MKIAYKNRLVNQNLVFGLLWLLFFFVGLVMGDDLHWVEFGWMVISIMYFCLYFYQKQKQYLSIENNVLRVTSGFGKQVNLQEIKHIKSFAGDYILYTDKSKLRINTQIIAPDSLANLNAELKKLYAEWT